MDYKVGTISGENITGKILTDEDLANAVDMIRRDYNQRYRKVDELMADKGFGILTDKH